MATSNQELEHERERKDKTDPDHDGANRRIRVLIVDDSALTAPPLVGHAELGTRD